MENERKRRILCFEDFLKIKARVNGNRIRPWVDAGHKHGPLSETAECSDTVTRERPPRSSTLRCRSWSSTVRGSHRFPHELMSFIVFVEILCGGKSGR